MNGMLIRGRKNKIGIASKMLAGAAALAVIAGLGIARADAAASKNATKELLLSGMSFFDPFTLQSTSISAAESGRRTEGDSSPILLLGIGTKSRPPIRIPYRPSVRSPFRPSL